MEITNPDAKSIALIVKIVLMLYGTLEIFTLLVGMHSISKIINKKS